MFEHLNKSDLIRMLSQARVASCLKISSGTMGWRASGTQRKGSFGNTRRWFLSRNIRDTGRRDRMLWEVKRDGQTKAHGPEESFPDSDIAASLLKAGYKIYVDGKIYKKRSEKKA